MELRMASHRTVRRLLVVAAVVSVPGAVIAQSSASYRLNEQVFNAGGRPVQAVTSSSPSFRLSLESIGEPVAARGLSGVSYRIDGGFASAYQPAGEVEGLAALVDQQTLTWSRDPASTAYNVYSGALSTLPGGYGGCAAPHVAGTTWSDSSTPAPKSGFFRLVTGVNRLGEEGTKGRTSAGTPRANPAPCP